MSNENKENPFSSLSELFRKFSRGEKPDQSTAHSQPQPPETPTKTVRRYEEVSFDSITWIKHGDVDLPSSITGGIDNTEQPTRISTGFNDQVITIDYDSRQLKSFTPSGSEAAVVTLTKSPARTETTDSAPEPKSKDLLASMLGMSVADLDKALANADTYFQEAANVRVSKPRDDETTFTYGPYTFRGGIIAFFIEPDSLKIKAISVRDEKLNTFLFHLDETGQKIVQIDAVEKMVLHPLIKLSPQK